MASGTDLRGAAGMGRTAGTPNTTLGGPLDSRAGLTLQQVPRGSPLPVMVSAGKFPPPACGRGGFAGCSHESSW